MDRIINILYKIKERPGIYIEKKSIVNLKIFLNGYYIAMYENDCDFNSVFDSFQNFIEKKYNNFHSLNWSDIILSDVKNDAEAFDMFFILLDEFISEYEIK